ncbi:MAG TPA: response regulator [Acidobacteriota bacterium]|nr:response regulator [Acidobacteriota bacterium]
MKKNSKQRKQTILIVEDDEQVLDIVERILSSDGYKTATAARASDAVRIAARIRPDIVILDLNLPDYNGIQVLREIKGIDPAIQVIILTGYGSQDTARSAMEIGAFDFLTKPVKFNELCAVVQEACISEAPVVNREDHHAQ